MEDFLKVENDLEKLKIGLSQKGRKAYNFIDSDFIPDGKLRVQHLYKIAETVEELKEAYGRGQSGKVDFQRENNALSHKIETYLEYFGDDKFQDTAEQMENELENQLPLLMTLRKEKKAQKVNMEEEELSGVSTMSAEGEKEEEERENQMGKSLSQRHSKAPEASQELKNLAWVQGVITAQMPKMIYLLGMMKKQKKEAFKTELKEILSTSIAQGGSDDSIKQMVLHRIKEWFKDHFKVHDQIFWTDLEKQIVKTYKGDGIPEEIARKFIAALKAELKDDNVVTQSQTAMSATFPTAPLQFGMEKRHVVIRTDDKTYIKGVRKGPKNQDGKWMIIWNDNKTWNWLTEGSKVGQFRLEGGGEKTKSKKKRKRKIRRKTKRKKKRRKKQTIRKRRKRGRKTRRK